MSHKILAMIFIEWEHFGQLLKVPHIHGRKKGGLAQTGPWGKVFFTPHKPWISWWRRPATSLPERGQQASSSVYLPAPSLKGSIPILLTNKKEHACLFLSWFLSSWFLEKPHDILNLQSPCLSFPKCWNFKVQQISWTKTNIWGQHVNYNRVLFIMSIFRQYLWLRIVVTQKNMKRADLFTSPSIDASSVTRKFQCSDRP